MWNWQELSLYWPSEHTFLWIAKFHVPVWGKKKTCLFPINWRPYPLPQLAVLGVVLHWKTCRTHRIMKPPRRERASRAWSGAKSYDFCLPFLNPWPGVRRPNISWSSSKRVRWMPICQFTVEKRVQISDERRNWHSLVARVVWPISLLITYPSCLREGCSSWS